MAQRDPDQGFIAPFSSFFSAGSTQVTGSSTFFVQQGLDVQGYLTNSLSNIVTISGTLKANRLISIANALTLSGTQTVVTGTLIFTDKIQITGPGNSAGNTGADFGSTQVNVGELVISRANNDSLRLQSNTSLRASSSSSLGWTVGDAGSTLSDTSLARNSAGVVAFTTGSGIAGVGSWIASSGTLSGALYISGAINWPNGTKLSSSLEGTLQITDRSGGLGAILLGSGSSGLMLWKNASQLNVTDQAGGFQNISVSQVFAQANVKVNSAGNTGFGLQLGSNSVSLFIKAASSSLSNWAIVDTAGTNPGYINQGQYTLGKATAYSLALVDNGIHFTTNGASAPVAFTILSSSTGAKYGFSATAGQNMTVTTLTGSIFAPGLTGATRTVLAANQYTNFDVVCYDGTNFIVRGLVGTLT